MSADEMSVAPGADVMHYYRALEGASERMLAAARSGDWDTVCRLEGACAVVIECLRRAREGRLPDADEQPERLRILRSILDNDAQIRQITEPLPRFGESEEKWGKASLAIH